MGGSRSEDTTGRREMDAAVTIGGLRVQPGERAMRVFDASVGDRTVPVPIVVINGRRQGPGVAITAGIHPSEYPAIQTARRLAVDLDPENVAGSLIIVLVANTTAFRTRSVFTSGLDGQNLNRLFPGDPGGKPSDILAAWLFREVISTSQYYIDLHGGDMIEDLLPFVGYPKTDDARLARMSRDMAVAADLGRVIGMGVGGSSIGAAVSVGIPSVIFEVGGRGAWNDEEVTNYFGGVTRTLQHLGVLSGEPPARAQPRVFNRMTALPSQADGVFEPTVRAGDTVTAGQKLGSIADYFGKELQRVEAVESGEVVCMTTSLAVNCGDPLFAVAVDVE